jgi:hypothetical protein
VIDKRGEKQKKERTEVESDEWNKKGIRGDSEEELEEGEDLEEEKKKEKEEGDGEEEENREK